MNTLIRKAVPADLPDLLKFEQGVIAAERPYDPTLRADPIRYYDFDFLLHRPEACLLVAEVEGALIAAGYARLETAKPYLRHRSYAYLGFMYVLPEHRGKGVNRLILEELEAWARAQGVHELRLEVYQGNEPAIKAYEKAGFSRHMIEMRKEV